MRFLCTLLLVCSPLLWGGDVSVVSLFPADTLTVPDDAQLTGLRVDLPLPDCSVEPSTCSEIQVLNQLDGFNINPRLAIQFSGPIDTGTLKDGIYIVSPAGDRISLNQAIYDPATNTVYAKPDNVLEQHTHYTLVVSDAVLDSNGQPVTSASTTFTTLSATAWMERARANLPNTDPAYARTGETNVFRFSDLKTFTLHQQVHANPTAFQDTQLPFNLLQSIDRIAFASYRSPTYLNGLQTIDGIPTGTDPGPGNSTNEIYFHALLPVSAKPAAGYPVVIYGHGLGDSRFGGPSAVSPVLGAAGFAVVGINAVGHGLGPESQVVMQLQSGETVRIPEGGRSIADSTGAIAPYGGCIVVESGFGIRDCLRQTALDIMQLVRVLKSGVDLDGDGTVDLDPDRIYYIGQSLGSLYGTILNAVEPDLHTAVLNVGGGSQADISRWSPAYRALVVQALAARRPALVAAGASTFNENYVLRGQPVKVNDVPGAIDIQNFFERLEWASAIGDPLAYAAHLKPSPLDGVPPKNILFLFGKGDQTVPNPTESALVRAADMRGSTWLYRHDLARAANPRLPADPHGYMTNILTAGTAQMIAFATQIQIAGFFESDGAVIPNPNILGINYFEIPAALPEDLNY